MLNTYDSSETTDNQPEHEPSTMLEHLDNDYELLELDLMLSLTYHEHQEGDV